MSLGSDDMDVLTAAVMVMLGLLALTAAVLILALVVLRRSRKQIREAERSARGEGRDGLD